MNVEQVLGQIQPRRKITGIAAALLPFEEGGSIAVEAFQNHLRQTHFAGLINAVNMDTGYVNYLSEQEQQHLLQWTREALPANTRFVAGAYIEGLEGDLVSLYRRKLDLIVEYGGTPIIFQTARLHGRTPQEIV